MSTYRIDSEVAKTRSRIAVATRRGNPEEIEEARRDHAAASIAAHIAKVVAEAPELSAAQRDRLASLLRGGGRA